MTELTMWHQIGAAIVGAAIVGNFLLHLIRDTTVDKRLRMLELSFQDILRSSVITETNLANHIKNHDRDRAEVDRRITGVNEKVNKNHDETMKVLNAISTTISRMEGAASK